MVQDDLIHMHIRVTLIVRHLLVMFLLEHKKNTFLIKNINTFFHVRRGTFGDFSSTVSLAATGDSASQRKNHEKLHEIE